MKGNRGRPAIVGILLAILSAMTGGCVTFPIGYDTAVPEARGALFEYPCCKDQPTGIAVSHQGRIFLNFPRWGKGPHYSVVEISEDGTQHPYPDTSWNRWGKGEAAQPEAHFICVQSVVVDDDDFLWVLDPASPDFAGVVPGGAKLVKIDLATNRVEQVIVFDENVALPTSYLNDVRFDPVDDFAYITDSGSGAIVIVDLASGTGRRLLAGHPSTRAEPGFVPVIDGKELRDASGRVPQIHANGIAIDADGTYLYYHALTARTLYRIRTPYLKDRTLTEKQLGSHVERVAETGAVDGILMDAYGNLHFTALEANAIKRLSPDGKVTTIVQDNHIHWPDSMDISPDDYLYFTDSQINLSPRFNNGTDRRIHPYRYYKIWLAPF